MRLTALLRSSVSLHVVKARGIGQFYELPG